MEFRSILKQERLNRGWTLKEMGEKINRSANAVYHYEKGSRTIDSETLMAISKLFNYEWKKNPNHSVKKVDESILTTTLRLYTEEQFEKYGEYMWRIANESDMINGFAIHQKLKHWTEQNELSEEAIKQMDNRLEKEELDAIHSGEWEIRAHSLYEKYGDVDEDDEEFYSETEPADYTEEQFKEYVNLYSLLEENKDDDLRKIYCEGIIYDWLLDNDLDDIAQEKMDERMELENKSKK